MSIANPTTRPHSVLAALSTAESRGAQDNARKRQAQRHSLRGEAVLHQIDHVSTEVRILTVQLRDISMAGIGFLSNQPVSPGTTWRLAFVAQGFPLGQQAVSIRHCNQIAQSAYFVGGQFCVEPGLLFQMGIDPEMLTREGGDDAAFLPPSQVA